jgi:hypothetical protein
MKATKHMLLVGALVKVTFEVVMGYSPLVCCTNTTTGQEKGQMRTLRVRWQFELRSNCKS